MANNYQAGRGRYVERSASQQLQNSKVWQILGSGESESEMQAVDDRRHLHSNEDALVVTNMAVAISAPDLYKKCK